MRLACHVLHDCGSESFLTRGRATPHYTFAKAIQRHDSRTSHSPNRQQVAAPVAWQQALSTGPATRWIFLHSQPPACSDFPSVLQCYAARQRLGVWSLHHGTRCARAISERSTLSDDRPRELQPWLNRGSATSTGTSAVTKDARASSRRPIIFAANIARRRARRKSAGRCPASGRRADAARAGIPPVSRRTDGARGRTALRSAGKRSGPGGRRAFGRLVRIQQRCAPASLFLTAPFAFAEIDAPWTSVRRRSVGARKYARETSTVALRLTASHRTSHCIALRAVESNQIIGGGFMEHATLSVVLDLRTPVSGFDPPTA
jgi:hypothetical protein